MNHQSKKNLNLSLCQSIIIFSVALALISLVAKLIIFKSFIFFNNSLELLIIVSGVIIYLSDLLLKSRKISLSNKQIITIFIPVIFVSSLFYILSKVYLLKNNVLPSTFSYSKYLNLMLALFLSGIIVLFLIFKNKVKTFSTFKVTISLFSFFLFLILLTLVFDAVLAGPKVKSPIINALVFGFFNTLIHYYTYTLYQYLRRKDEALHKDNKTSIVGQTLLLFVALYTVFALIKDFNHLLYVGLSGPSLPLFVIQIKALDLFFFIYATLFITLVIFSLKFSLNKAYPQTKVFVNSAVIIWLIKIVNNILQRINNHLLSTLTISTSNHAAINSVLTIISLVFNISLLLLGLLIIFKNKFPNLKLWLSLAIVQVINFVLNFVFSLIAKEPVTFFNQEITRLSVNFCLTIAKLVFVFLIIIQYQKPIKSEIIPESNF